MDETAVLLAARALRDAEAQLAKHRVTRHREFGPTIDTEPASKAWRATLTKLTENAALARFRLLSTVTKGIQ